jgi:phosphatidylglycerol:prolipoprotein diacylglycerol transferase
MLPTIPIGPLRLQTFGLFLILGYVAGQWLAARQARRHGLEPDHIYNAGFFALLGGLLAARIGHVIAFVEIYRADPLQILSLSPGALLPLAGLAGALLVLAFYVWRLRLPPLQVADALAPGVLLGLAIAALGGFLAGRSLGVPSEVPWAMEAFGVRRHPVALYMALATLAWLAVVLWADRQPRPPGWVALLAIFGYAATVLFLAPLAADSLTLTGGWRVPQILALVAVGASGWLLGRMAGRKRSVPA